MSLTHFVRPQSTSGVFCVFTSNTFYTIVWLAYISRSLFAGMYNWIWFKIWFKICRPCCRITRAMLTVISRLSIVQQFCTSHGLLFKQRLSTTAQHWQKAAVLFPCFFLHRQFDQRCSKTLCATQPYSEWHTLQRHRNSKQHQALNSTGLRKSAKGSW